MKKVLLLSEVMDLYDYKIHLYAEETTLKEYSSPALYTYYLTLSFTQDTNHHYPTLAHLNASSSVIIHHRDLPMVSFNSELNSTTFHSKFLGCMKNRRSPTRGKSVFDALSPKGVDK